MKTFTYLFLGGSQRVTIGKMLMKAAAASGFEPHIVGYELDSVCPLASIAKIEIGLKWNDPDIYRHLQMIADKYDVKAVIPFVDSAVAVAANFALKSNIYAPVGDSDTATLMFDKVAAAAFFESKGIPVPATYQPGMPCLRLIAKPRFGSASQGIISINSLEHLDRVTGNESNYLIQERIDNRQEISVDCFVSVTDGEILAVSPRVRLRVSGGEVILTRTIDDAEVVELTKKVLAATNLRGAVTVQFIRDLDNGRLMVMEVNPRLGGGAVASVNAGVDIPGIIVNEASGKKSDAQTPVAGVTTARYLADTVFYPDNYKA